jgi:hypothetical protein
MRAIDCQCGHRLEGADDEALGIWERVTTRKTVATT